MRHFKSISTGTGLSVFMAVLVGCDSTERIQAPPTPSQQTIGAVGIDDSSAFDRDLIHAKAGDLDPAQRDQAVRSVLDKYGVDYPRVSAPVEPGTGPNALGTQPIGAAKAARTFNPVRRDLSASAADIVTFVYTAFVRKGEGLAAVALGNTTNVDPFLVAYYSDHLPTPIMHTVTVVAYNDDISGSNRSARISWTNNTGIDKNITVVAFAYSSSTRGLGHVVVNTSSSSKSFVDQPIGGLKQLGATPVPTEPTPCVFRNTRMTFNYFTGVSTNIGALVIDLQAMKGGSMTRLAHILDLPWRVSNPYPSFGMLFAGAATPAGTAQLIQQDMYTCVE